MSPDQRRALHTCPFKDMTPKHTTDNTWWKWYFSQVYMYVHTCEHLNWTLALATISFKRLLFILFLIISLWLPSHLEMGWNEAHTEALQWVSWVHTLCIHMSIQSCIRKNIYQSTMCLIFSSGLKSLWERIGMIALYDGMVQESLV